LQALGLQVLDGQQVFLAARRIKTIDQISLLVRPLPWWMPRTTSVRFLRPGVRENELRRHGQQDAL